jgi:transcriptional regulator with XRE-family HTH domain
MGNISMKNILDFKAISTRIKEARTDAEQSQKQLADLLECDQGYVSQIETGITKPSLAFLAALSKFSGQSIDYLLFGKSVNRHR